MSRIVSIVSKVEGDISILDALSTEFYSSRTIYLTGEINSAMAEEIIAQVRILARRSKEPITMIINSPGGEVTAGLAIIDVMQGCGCEMHTTVAGMAASMASFILAAGTKGCRGASAHSEVMIHQPLGGTSGQASDIAIASKHIIKTRGILARMLADFTGKSEKTILTDMERDKWLDAKQSVRYGITDFVVEEI